MQRKEVKPELEAETEPRPAFPITLRAVLLGAIAVGLLASINPYLAWVSLTWDVGSGSLLQSPVFVLFLLVIFNSLLIRIWPGRATARRAARCASFHRVAFSPGCSRSYRTTRATARYTS